METGLLLKSGAYMAFVLTIMLTFTLGKGEQRHAVSHTLLRRRRYYRLDSRRSLPPLEDTGISKPDVCTFLVSLPIDLYPILTEILITFQLAKT